MALALSLAHLLGIFLSTRAALASPPDVQISVEPDVVEVGDAAEVTLTVLTDEGAASAPELVAPGLAVRGPRVGTRKQFSFDSRGARSLSGIEATWTVSTEKVGTYTLRATAIAGGRATAPQSATLRVVARGKAPRRRAGNDPFGFGLPFDFDPPKVHEPDLPTDLDLAISNPPRAKDLFLVARYDKTNLFVGEPTAARMLLYVNPDVGNISITDLRAPEGDGFARQAIVQTAEPPWKKTLVGSDTWKVKEIGRYLFTPLKAGELSLRGARGSVPSSQGYLARESPATTFVVLDAPLDGRPSGYEEGVVGDFALETEVEPRALVEGGKVFVTITTVGRGSFPSRVRVPLRPEVEWSPPQTRDDLRTTEHGLEGRRTFTFEVTPRAAGRVDLGEVTFSSFNPGANAYRTHSAKLGDLDVTAAGKASSSTTTERADDPLARLPPLHAELARTAPRSSGRWVDLPLVRLAIAAPPVLWMLLFVSLRVFAKVRHSRRTRRTTPAAELTRLEREMRRALGDGRADDVTVALSRWMRQLARAHHDVDPNVHSDPREALERAGAEGAEAFAILWRNLESARFAGSKADLAEAKLAVEQALEFKKRWGAAR